MQLTESARLFERSHQCIPGGVVSLNRRVQPEIAFVRGRGAHVWDADDNRYIDYHAGFAPYLLGHADPDVEANVYHALEDGWTLMGSGTTPWETRLAELIVDCIPSVEKVQLTTSGSEATYHALRLARAYTSRSHIIVMQGGYNGWYDEVACNVMTPLEQLGPRVSPGEYPYLPLSAGAPPETGDRVHIVNFNDVGSLEYVFNRYSIAAVLTEPILQNIGVVHPFPGYLSQLRSLCDRYGAMLIFDEVKTGFRHALGGYQNLVGVRPDLSTFGKAIANGYPLGALGGRSELMDLFASPDPARRVLIAGTYNGHPVPVAAAIATVEKLASYGDEIYAHLEALGERMQAGLEALFEQRGLTASVARQGSAFCVYFMDHLPADWHDIAENHNMDFDLRYRRSLIDRGIYHFPLPTKQGSISAAHTEADIDATLTATAEVLAELTL